MFQLDRRLLNDTIPVGRLGLSRLLLMNNRLWPWLILVPERPGVTELYQLSPADRACLIEELAVVAAHMAALFSPDKLNLGALGNLVPQLHLHVIARWRDDPAWPGPVWGCGRSESYADSEAQALVTRLGEALGVTVTKETK